MNESIFEKAPTGKNWQRCGKMVISARRVKETFTLIVEAPEKKGRLFLLE